MEKLEALLDGVPIVFGRNVSVRDFQVMSYSLANLDVFSY